MYSNKEDTLVLLLEGLGDHNFSLCEGDKDKSEVRENCLGILHNNYLMKSKARFQRRTFHEPNLIAPIKYMTRSTFESIKFNRCYLGRP